MSLDKCRITVEKIGNALDLLYQAEDDGAWLDGRTLSRIKCAIGEVEQVKRYATSELAEIERNRIETEKARAK